ncbi:MAG: D-glycerate dehydrogenase [Chloroflexi bacterium]|nr:D-glycerate dehydrogenase [Ardenticatenaceae bacterium]MBL1128650.1 D-glycerate dehydrogenase [Chloroflexota bacterium]NOG34728.1 D-glycerate dehydrogenase [Chloroflexota bacterium]GIK55061.1 MAG: glycerate dehydrogenase [Chloroflexota bacterium]
MPKVVITQSIYDQTLQLLAQAGIPYFYHQGDTWSPAELKAQIRGATAVVCLLADKMTAEVMDAAPRLKLIANVAVGYDNIDIPAATQRGILVTNTPDVLTETTADLAFALILAVARRIPEADAYMRAGQYTRFALFPDMIGTDVHGKTLGIVGLGRIGTAVARRAALGFNMKVLYTADTPKPDVERELGVIHVAFPDLLQESDFISIHVPLSPRTRHLFTMNEFLQMRGSAYIINTARGPIIKEADLVEALQKGIIRGAALDVFEEEPQMYPGLADIKDRLVVTPHVGSATIQTRQKMATLAVQNVVAFLTGQPPLTPVNPQVYHSRS